MNTYRTRVRLLSAVSLALMLAFIPHTANGIKIKKPKIRIGKPKIHIPPPNQIAKNVTAVVADASKDVTKAAEVAVIQIEKTVSKAGKDVVMEAGRVPAHVVDVGEAAVAYVTSYGDSAMSELEQAQRRIEEGKLVDLLYHLAVAPLKAQEEAAFKATQESGWVNSAGSVAAAAYGGPGGAAAYAAWQTYRLTNGNVEMAIRAGVIAGMTKAATGELSLIEATTTPDVVKKAVLAGAIGGLAVAASGGEEDDIRKAVILGGGMVLLQDGYKSYVGHDLEAKAATKLPYCINAKDPSCEELRKAYSYDEKTQKLKLDPSKLDKMRANVGLQTNVGTLSDPKFEPSKIFGGQLSDQSNTMQFAARIPAFNAMSLFHDKWVVDWDMGPAGTVATIIPAVALTYVATGAPLFAAIAKENAEKDNSSRQGDKSASGPTLGTTPNPPTSPDVTDASKKATSEMKMERGDPAAIKEAVEAVDEYQSSLSKSTDKLVAKNVGTEKIVEGVVKPVVGRAWSNPGNPADLKTRRLKGLYVDASGAVQPEPGWEWTNPNDALSTDVRPVEGLEVTPTGKLQPKDGWDWVDAKDPANLAVIKVSSPK